MLIYTSPLRIGSKYLQFHLSLVFGGYFLNVSTFLEQYTEKSIRIMLTLTAKCIFLDASTPMV